MNAGISCRAYCFYEFMLDERLFMSTYQADQANLAWQVSRTCDGGQCIGVARRGDAVLIGNTSDPQAPVSEFTVSEWQQFLAGVKLGDFDKIA